MRQKNRLRKKQPIFVLGTARSGTSWLANLLATHPDVGAAATGEHKGITGIHESHLFSHTRYCFPERNTCREFISRYKEEDYFKLTGLSPHAFCDGHPGTFTVYELFRAIMDEFAENVGAHYWVEKTPKHTIYYRELIRYFPDAYFVVTRRGFRQTVLSNVNTYPRKGATVMRQVVEKVFRYVSDTRAIRRLKRQGRIRVIEVKYEDLLKNTQEELGRVLAFVKLEERELYSTFPTNSSYELGKQERREFGLLGWTGIYVVRGACWLMPFSVMHYLRRRRDMQSAKKFPKYTFIPTPKQWSGA